MLRRKEADDLTQPTEAEAQEALRDLRTNLNTVQADLESQRPEDFDEACVYESDTDDGWVDETRQFVQLEDTDAVHRAEAALFDLDFGSGRDEGESEEEGEEEGREEEEREEEARELERRLKEVRERERADIEASLADIVAIDRAEEEEKRAQQAAAEAEEAARADKPPQTPRPGGGGRPAGNSSTLPRSRPVVPRMPSLAIRIDV